MLEKRFIFLLIALTALPGCKKNEASAQSGTNDNFKTVGYLLINRPNLMQDMVRVDFSRLTHLNLAFVNPDATGAFPDNPLLPQLVKMAHDHQVKVLLSIGGGEIPAWVTGFLTDDKRAAFVSALTEVVSRYDIDGVDVDLEGSSINEHYATFVADLSIALKAKKKLITAAIATVYGPTLPDEALARFDFVNIMSYDKTGPWNPALPGQHSPYDMAVSDLTYWGKTRGIPKEKITLGLPFYGYGFGANQTTSGMSFGDIIAGYPGAENKDQVTLGDGETMYYNGIPTIRSKAALAVKEAGGLMIWEILQDAQGANSLLKNMNDVITHK
ncbi:glycosyl hydrolase family 18 protein [Flavitalea flava]